MSTRSQSARKRRSPIAILSYHITGNNSSVEEARGEIDRETDRQGTEKPRDMSLRRRRRAPDIGKEFGKKERWNQGICQEFILANLIMIINEIVHQLSSHSFTLSLPPPPPPPLLHATRTMGVGGTRQRQDRENKC